MRARIKAFYSYNYYIKFKYKLNIYKLVFSTDRYNYVVNLLAIIFSFLYYSDMPL